MMRKSALLVLLLLISIAVIPPTRGQTTQEERLFVNDARPVGHAVLELTDRYPVLVTYEDPRFEYEGDLVEFSRRVNPNAPPDRRAVVPRGGYLEVTFDVSSATHRPIDLARALGEMLEFHDQSGFPGRFAIEQTGSVFHIVPSEVRDAEGHWVPQTSILETPITIEAQEVNGIQALHVIVAKVQEVSGIGTGVASYEDDRTLMESTVQLEAHSESARDVLLRTLQSISKDHWTWLLYYGPDIQSYALNLRAVPAQPIVISSEAPIPTFVAPTGSGKSFFDRPDKAPEQ